MKDMLVELRLKTRRHDPRHLLRRIIHRVDRRLLEEVLRLHEHLDVARLVGHLPDYEVAVVKVLHRQVSPRHGCLSFELGRPWEQEPTCLTPQRALALRCHGLSSTRAGLPMPNRPAQAPGRISGAPTSATLRWVSSQSWTLIRGRRNEGSSVARPKYSWRYPAPQLKWLVRLGRARGCIAVLLI